MDKSFRIDYHFYGGDRFSNVTTFKKSEICHGASAENAKKRLMRKYKDKKLIIDSIENLG